MENEELGQLLSKLDKKLDKILKMTTTIAKSLHLVPVSEKEEREIQLLQRKNTAVMQKIQDELANLEEKPKESEETLSINRLFEAGEREIYEDILGDDILS